jgi:hypothetical protein
MHPLDDSFYARLFTLSDAELFNYIHHYSRYKVDAVHAALAELRTRGVYVSQDALAEIDRYFTHQEAQRTRLCTCDPRWLRWLSYAMLTLGLGSAVFLYVTASPPPPHPLGYDPFASKKYVRELELYGGKINVLAVAFRQWLESLWRGQHRAYTLAFLTVMLSSILWFIGSHAASHVDTHAEKHNVP